MTRTHAKRLGLRSVRRGLNRASRALARGIGRCLLREVKTSLRNRCEQPFDLDGNLNGEGEEAVKKIIQEMLARDVWLAETLRDISEETLDGIK